MDNLLDNDYKDIFFSLLAAPDKAGTVPVDKLEELVKVYPQVSILRAMLARAYKDTYRPGFDSKLKSASVYTPDRPVLYKVINYPDKLQVVDESQVFLKGSVKKQEPVQQKEITALPQESEIAVLEEEDDNNPYHYENDVQEAETKTFDELDEGAILEEEGYSVEEEDDEEFDEDKYLAAMETQIPKSHHEGAYLPEADEEGNDDENDYNSAVEEETATGFNERELIAAAGRGEEAESEIDDEIFDEITGIEDIAISSSPFKLIVEDGIIQRDADDTIEDDEEDTGLVLHEAVIDEDEEIDEPEARQHTPYYEEPRQALSNDAAEEEKLILSNIAGADYFAFNDKFPAAEDGMHETVAQEEQTVPAPVAVQNQADIADDDGRVSKYNDDKLPYSFMWWLDKTRREYAGTYQPYAAYKQTGRQMQPGDTMELQQQYYENIFHLTTIENLDKARAEFDNGKHEDQIIERFIKEEPQIKPPSNDKLDNENKAKKSAEDQDDMVSETLARIYIDQMLYHKAITTYKKLLLKFPEKSSYFVAQIELLEKKIN
ncbi:hypothetical protein KXQ82_15285 [Mucilaginibacter sp. HMF5004]|uniref:hypothetical protein n=1 Tax=Mucilaginibacter rivuli TaxID=2857527 RepID=UPI001C5FDBBC|nr:hypothetical protein [Mucilaginibacter rivuli]MBW4891088.1 hypothetical protein [Mucilaginibacter rivuli]